MRTREPIYVPTQTNPAPDELVSRSWAEQNISGGTGSVDPATVPIGNTAGATDGMVWTFDSASGGWLPKAASGGVSDHGALTGLDQNHHPHYQLRSERGAAGGYAPLDAGSRVPEQHIPAAALGLPYEVASEAAMLALTVEPGDVAIRSDLNKSFMLRAAPASTLTNWAELRTPTDQVLSVDGRTGAVSLSDSYAPLAHKARHATGSADALTPSDIGAAPASHVGTGGTAHANATSSVAGFQSAADKGKLDGVMAGAGTRAGYIALGISANREITSMPYFVNFDVVREGTASLYNAAGEYVPPSDGLYFAVINTYLQQLSAGQQIVFQVRVNGSSYRQPGRTIIPASGGMGVGASALVPLLATDRLSFQIAGTGTATLNASVTETYCQIMRLSA